MLPDLLKIISGVPLKFSLSVTLGEGQEITSEKIEKSVSQLLEKVSAEPRLATTS